MSRDEAAQYIKIDYGEEMLKEFANG